MPKTQSYPWRRNGIVVLPTFSSIQATWTHRARLLPCDSRISFTGLAEERTVCYRDRAADCLFWELALAPGNSIAGPLLMSKNSFRALTAGFVY
jgi:hypothetical protein